MTIFVDMDEVLANTYERHIELYNEEFDQDLKLEDIAYGEVWQNVPEAHQKSVHKHAKTKGFYLDLVPKKDSISVMKALYEKYEVYIATAATQFPYSLYEKSVWLEKHFPFIEWQHQIMCGHKFILRGDLLIDDRTYNLNKFVGDTYLFNAKHNLKEQNHKRVYSWLEIAERLL